MNYGEMFNQMTLKGKAIFIAGNVTQFITLPYTVVASAIYGIKHRNEIISYSPLVVDKATCEGLGKIDPGQALINYAYNNCKKYTSV